MNEAIDWVEELPDIDSDFMQPEWEESEVRRGGRGRPSRPRQPTGRQRRTAPPSRRPGRGGALPRRPRPPRRPGIRPRPSRYLPREPLCTCPAQDCPQHGSEYVRWVQSSLNQIQGLNLPVNGIMDAATRSALRRFQEQQGLTVDGIAGPETKQALIEARKQPLSQNELDEENWPAFAESDYEIIGSDDRIPVTDATAAPFRYICSIEYEFGGKTGTKARGTAFLVGPSTAVTAGHIVDRLRPEKMRLIPGRVGSREPFGSSRAVSFHLAPNYRSGTSTDYAVIRLAHPIGNSAGFWSRAYRRGTGDSIGTSFLDLSQLRPEKVKVNLSGYPRDLPVTESLRCRPAGAQPGSCRVNSRALQSRLCGSYPYRTYDQSTKRSGGLLRYLNDTCPGHSGSPVWVRRSPDRGGRVLVGIHIVGSKQDNAAVLLSPEVQRFIADNTR